VQHYNGVLFFLEPTNYNHTITTTLYTPHGIAGSGFLFRFAFSKLAIEQLRDINFLHRRWEA
jgi:hypothetical protein